MTTNSIYIGYNSRGLNNSNNNSIVSGYNANGLGANTVVLGNDSITTTALKGNVGIGTTSPTSRLTVSGDITMSGIMRNINSQTDNGDLTIAFTRNVMKTDQSCGATTLSGLADGGKYSLLYNGTAGGTCSFTHAGLTVVLPQGHGAIPGAQRALYTFIVIGTEIFVTYVTY